MRKTVGSDPNPGWSPLDELEQAGFERGVKEGLRQAGAHRDADLTEMEAEAVERGVQAEQARIRTKLTEMEHRHRKHNGMYGYGDETVKDWGFEANQAAFDVLGEALYFIDLEATDAD